jgi:hypothetical protein
MKNKITIVKATISESRLQLLADQSISGLIPSEQILADSKQYSFIYLMENQEDYTYIDIPEQNWPLLKVSLEEQIPVWIYFKDEYMELKNFHEELNDLIGNIRGNSNYGEKMVRKVESVF